LMSFAGLDPSGGSVTRDDRESEDSV